MAPWGVVLALCFAGVGGQDRWMSWFESELRTAEDVALNVSGTLPPYISGLFVQPGPGRFSMGDRSMNHALDGFSKVNRLVFDAARNSIRFSAQFLASSFYNKSVSLGTIAHGLLMSETTPPRQGPGMLNVFTANDNNYIKARKIGDAEIIASDTTVVTVMDRNFSIFRENLAPSKASAIHSHWEDDIEPAGLICMMAAFAHGYEDPTTGEFLTVMSCINPMPGPLPQYHVIFKIDPAAPRKRHLVASLEIPGGRRSSYMHSFAVTESYIVLVAGPLFMNTQEVLLGHAMACGVLAFGEEDALFQVVDRKSGALLRELWAPGFLPGHVVNSFEDAGDIVIDVTYSTVQSHGFFERFKLENLKNRAYRDVAARGTLMRYRLTPDGHVESSFLLPSEPACDIDLVKIHPARSGHSYCVFWGVQFGSSPKEGFESFALVKRNICTGEKVTVEVPGHFPSEHEFVPLDPDGAGNEDEGVLIGLVYDSIKASSYVQVLDARTLLRVADAPLGLRVPFPVHSSFFPAQAASSHEFSVLI